MSANQIEPRTFVVAPSAAAGRRWCVANQVDPHACVILTSSTTIHDYLVNPIRDRVQYVPGWQENKDLAGFAAALERRVFPRQKNTASVMPAAPGSQAEPPAVEISVEPQRVPPLWFAVLLVAVWVTGLATGLIATVLAGHQW